MSVLFSQVVKASSAFSRILEYMKREPSIRTSGGHRPSQVSGNITFNDVTFSYPSRPTEKVLESFSLDIPAGNVVALCGPSGSGKSTVGALIERFYDVDSGDVELDGFNIKTLDPRWIRKNIGYIHQEPILFAGTIYDNITYGTPEASYEQVVDATRQANAFEFINGFEHKFDTVVGERGVSLSGGQRQRIAIARALLKNPKILIFDEATSALDANSERIVQDALDKLMEGRTVLIIAHRLSTIQNADKIIVLSKGGHIVESGTHAQLMRNQGPYYGLYNSSKDA